VEEGTGPFCETAMAANVEQLEQRLAAVEQELAELRRDRAAAPPKPRRRRGLLELADARHEESVANIEAVFREMGIEGEPVGAEKLRQMMLDEGVSEDNSFSRGIIEMREE
jgi:hypothetical protein